jgi:deoxyribonuclease-4
MLRVGLHVSISGSIDRSVDRARELGCTTFQIFTRNPRGWASKPLRDEEVEGFRQKVKEYGYDVVVAHMPYLPNLSSPKEETFQRSLGILKEELERCGVLDIPYLVTHLGSHMGEGEEVGLNRVVQACSEALSAVDNDVMILLEITAGTKNSVGYRFEHLRYIMDRVEASDRLGVCFDTCHAFAAGYELRTPEGVRATLQALDEAVGLKHMKVVHLNDSKGDYDSHVDRHEHIGLGAIGEEGFRAILGNPEIRSRPLILETPVDARRDDKGNLLKVLELAG